MVPQLPISIISKILKHAIFMEVGFHIDWLEGNMQDPWWIIRMRSKYGVRFVPVYPRVLRKYMLINKTLKAETDKILDCIDVHPYGVELRNKERIFEMLLERWAMWGQGYDSDESDDDEWEVASNLSYITAYSE